MLKEILSLLDVRDLISTKYFYSFENNLCCYFVYRDNEYKVFDLERFQHIRPDQLITEFFIDEENFRSEIKKREGECSALDKLIDTRFEKALGQFLGLKYLEHTSHVESIAQSDIDYFSKLDFLKDRFFLTKFGMAMFSKSLQEKIPAGMIYFNRFNCKSFGSYKVFIPRLNSENINVDQEETIVLFSPYTLKDCFESGKSHYKDTLFIISNTDELTKKDLFPNFSVHVRPTTQELANYLRYMTYYMNQNDIPATVVFTENNEVKFRSYCSNYAKLRSNWLPKLESQKSILTGKEIVTEYRVACLKKNARPGADLFEFSFPKNPENMIVFIQYFMFSFYNNTKLELKRITIIHYEKEFPEIMELSVVADDLQIEDNYTPVTNEDDVEFDDTF